MKQNLWNTAKYNIYKYGINRDPKNPRIVISLLLHLYDMYNDTKKTIK